jgi:hypothetical protein
MKDVLTWTFTNENLDAITSGLDLNSSDRVLAVGGSGDQALAILEYADSVHLTDTNPAQIEYILRRIEKLNRGDFEGFLEAPAPEGFIRGKMTKEIAEKELKRRNDYFFTGRLERIASRLDKLEVECANVVYVAARNKDFSKIYLSNIIGYEKNQFKRGPNVLDMSSQNLPKDGLIYSAVHGQMQHALTYFVLPEDLPREGFKILQYLTQLSRQLPKGLELDRELTRKAAEIEFEGARWLPGVYRKAG